VRTDWNPVLRSQFDEPYWKELQQFVATERQRHTVYPPHDEVFAAVGYHQLPDVEPWVHDWAAASALPSTRADAPSLWS